MDDFGERHAKLVLIAHGFDAVLNVWQLLAECPDAGQAALSPLHEVMQVGTEQIETASGNTAKVGRLEAGAGDNERAAEPLLVAGLAVTVIGHVLGTCC